MKKAIILFMIWAVTAQAQTVIFSDGTNIFTGVGGNYTNINDAIGIVKPAYGELSAGGADVDVMASSVIVTDGTIDSGSVICKLPFSGPQGR